MRNLIPLIGPLIVVVTVGAFIQFPGATASTLSRVLLPEAPVAPAIVTYCSTFAPIAIPDGTGTAATGTLPIPAAATILDANVRLSVTHGWVGDLMIRVSNGSQTALVINRPLLPASPPDGCAGDNIVGSYVDDEGADGTWENSCINALPAYPAGSRLIGGDPADKTLMDLFDNGSTAGTWSVSVSDHLEGDAGTLDGFCMEFTIPGEDPTATPTPQPPSPTATATEIAPSPTATLPLPTATGTLFPATPTATPDAPLPTATPSATLAPPTATPTLGTPSPTVTGTPPTATPTFTATVTEVPLPQVLLYLPLVWRDESSE